MMNPPFDLQAFLTTGDGGRTISSYRKKEAIFRQGDKADGVFYIMHGECKVTILSEQGKEAVIALPKTGDFLGEGCLSGQPRRIATVTAMTKSKIMRIDKAAMGACCTMSRNFPSCSFRTCWLGMPR